MGFKEIPTSQEWLINERKKLSVPQGLAWKIVKAHNSICYEMEALYEWLVQITMMPDMGRVINSIIASCVKCTQNNAYTRLSIPPLNQAVQAQGKLPGED